MAIPRFAPSDCMLGDIQAILADSGAPACLSLTDIGRVWIDPGSATYRAEPGLPNQFFEAPTGSARITKGEAPGGLDQARPVDELLYRAAYHGAQDALLAQCQPYDVVELTSWPNFTRLPHTRHMITLCSLLSRRPTSLVFAYRMLRMPEAEALRFCSAVSAAGHVRVISSQPAATGSHAGSGSAQDDDSKSTNSIWSRLFNRIAGL